MELGAQPQPLEDAGGVALGLPAPQLGKFLLQEAGLDAVLLGHFLLGVEGVLLLADVIQSLVAHNDRIHDVVRVIGVLVLLEHRHAGFGEDRHLSRGGLQVPGENFQKGGLARAVGPNDAIAVALDELQVHMGKEGLSAVLQPQIGNGNHIVLLFAD